MVSLMVSQLLAMSVISRYKESSVKINCSCLSYGLKVCIYVFIAGAPCYEGSVQNLLENACREAEIYKDSQVVSYDMCFSLILITYTS